MFEDLENGVRATLVIQQSTGGRYRWFSKEVDLPIICKGMFIVDYGLVLSVTVSITGLVKIDVDPDSGVTKFSGVYKQDRIAALLADGFVET